MLLLPGYFSRRGGILDVWPPAEKYPVRLDFFGDEIETIRSFDPATQRTFKNRTEVLVTPAREILPGWAIGLDFEGKDIGEFYLPLIHPGRSSLLDYLPKETLILLDDLDHIQAAADEIEEQAVKLRQSSIQEELLDEDFPIPYFPLVGIGRQPFRIHKTGAGIWAKRTGIRAGRSFFRLAKDLPAA